MLKWEYMRGKNINAQKRSEDCGSSNCSIHIHLISCVLFSMYHNELYISLHYDYFDLKVTENLSSLNYNNWKLKLTVDIS